MVRVKDPYPERSLFTQLSSAKTYGIPVLIPLLIRGGKEWNSSLQLFLSGIPVTRDEEKLKHIPSSLSFCHSVE